MNQISWETHEYFHNIKTAEWYWTVAIITGALAITCIIFGNFLFALVLAIGVFALTLFSVRKPNVIRVVLDDRGVLADKILHPYDTLDAFGMDENHHSGPRLLLKSKKVVVPLVSIPVSGHSADEIRVFLKKHLKEETIDQGFLHHLLEKLGF